MEKFRIRIARLSDNKFLFKWRNNDKTLKMSRSSKKIEWLNHNKWFKNKINCRSVLILICEDTNTLEKLGMIRFNFNKLKSLCEVSINLNPKFRSKGKSKIYLRESIIFMKKLHLSCKIIFAEIKNNNFPSQKLFNNLGFKKFGKKNFGFNHFKFLTRELDD